jgi:hypothetical protein
VARLGQAERKVFLSRENAFDVALLIFGAVVGERRNDREIANDGGFVLQVVVQAEPFGGEMFADGGNREIGGARAAAGFRQSVAQMAGLVGSALHFRNQRAPFRARTPVVIPVRPSMLAPVVEELHIFALERLDFGLDERVKLRKFVGDLLGQVEVHARGSLRFLL